MPIPSSVYEEAESVLDEYCKKAIPEHAYGKVKIGYYTKGMIVTLYEEHPCFRDKDQWIRSDVARFRYNKTHGEWTLYWSDRNLKWHIYGHISPARKFNTIFKEVKKDPTGIFWG